MNVVSATPATSTRGERWLERFIAVQIACQLLLLVDVGALRVLVRMGVFGSSLALLVLLPRTATTPRHPATGLAFAILGWLAVSLVHPSTVPASGLAQATLYVAVLSPLLWVPRLSLGVRSLERVLLILWAFHTASALLGVLQVYYPGRFQPNVSAVIAGSKYMGEGLKITLASGQRIFRPMGLTDTPGGAAMGGSYAVILGVGLLLTRREPWLRVACAGSLFAGMFCLYLCQIRSLVVQVVFCLALIATLLLKRGRAGRSIVIAVVVGTVALAALSVAIAVGGDSVTQRLTTLISGDPGTVYYRNRGIFLEHTIFGLLPEYPLGAGLGRWGMMAYYFAEGRGADLYAEIQWTAWVLDGGLPLALLYAAAVGTAIWIAGRIARVPADLEALALWAIVILAYDVGALALTFNYVYFQAQSGLEFWMLNAVLFTAAANALARRRRTEPPA